MIGYITDFFTAALTAIVLQNAFFTRGLGVSRVSLGRHSKEILFFGGIITFVATVSALFSWPLNQLLRGQPWIVQMKIPFLHIAGATSLVIICAVFLAVYLMSKRFFPRIHYQFSPISSRLLFNCAILGTILLTLRSASGYLTTVAFAFGSGVGYTLALLLLLESKRRIMLCDVPRAFRGFPILMLYAGIFSLAIYGLIGHQLPT